MLFRSCSLEPHPPLLVPTCLLPVAFFCLLPRPSSIRVIRGYLRGRPGSSERVPRPDATAVSSRLAVPPPTPGARVRAVAAQRLRSNPAPTTPPPAAPSCDPACLPRPLALSAVGQASALIATRSRIKSHRRHHLALRSASTRTAARRGPYCRRWELNPHPVARTGF